MQRAHYDTVVIGAGPAGVACALTLAKYQKRILLVDAQHLPQNKVCGQGIMPPGVSSLKELRVLEHVDERFCHKILGLKIIHGQQKAQANFKEGKGLGISRHALSRALRKRILETSQIEFLENTRVRSVSAANRMIHVCAKERSYDVHANFVVAADGLKSRFRTQLNPSQNYGRNERFAIRTEVSIKPWSSHVEVHITDGVEAYVTPSGKSVVNIIFIFHKHGDLPKGGSALIEYFFSKFEKLRSKIASHKHLQNIRGCGPFYVLPKHISDNQFIALVGDAAGYVDPLSGEGINLGLVSGMHLGEAIGTSKKTDINLASNLHLYAKGFRKIFDNHRRFTDALIFLRSYPPMLRLSLKLLNRYPRLFQFLMSINMGTDVANSRTLFKVFTQRSFG